MICVMDGLLPIWKPKGITSYDAIRAFKRLYKGVKIGHAGTLDPFAEGVLIIMLGKATKRFDEIQGWTKEYRAVARLGAKSDSLDETGNITVQSEKGVGKFSEEKLKEVIKKYVGEIDQEVPQFSAAKYKGKPLYKYARKGEETPKKTKKITIYSLEVGNIEEEKVELSIRCSSGTYIRQLSYDIFKNLNIDSYLCDLMRERVGEIGKEECLTLPQLENEDMVRSRLLPFPDESEF